jgi:hypothetical protein
LNGKHTQLASYASVEGLAWRPDGKELWCGATKTEGWADTIFALTLSGKERTILTLPSLRLHDISKDGLVLLSRETWRRQIKGLFPGDKAEHPYSWLDDTAVTGISRDGKIISMYEAGEVYSLQNNSLAYYRVTDGSPPVRLGVGTAVISPDGKWVIAGSNHARPRLPLQLQPIGPGEARDLPTSGLTAFDHYVWSDDGRLVAYEAQTEQNQWNVYTQAVAGGAPVLIKTEGRGAYPLLSPDGETLALREGRAGIMLFHLKGGAPVALKGASESEYPICFVKEGKAMLVAEQTGGDLLLTVIDLASGHREAWKHIAADYASRVNQLFVATDDLKYYAYPFPKYSSVLYTVENLH